MTPDEQGMELKPCPFCGGDAVCSPADDSGDVVYGVACMSCQAQITKCDEAGAIQQWNLRTIPAQPSSVAERVAGVIEREFYKFVDDPPLPGTKPFEHIACAAIAALQENRG